MPNSFPLSGSLQDISAKGPRRTFTLIGSVDCVVILQRGLSLGSTSFGTVMDPDNPSQPLTLKGASMSSREFTEPSSFLRYNLLSGTVTSCYFDSSQEPAAGPAGSPAPQLVPTATKTANYTAAAYDLVQCDPSGGAFSVTFPLAAGVPAGTPICVKNVTASTTAITVAKTGGDSVDGSTSGTINTSKGVKTYRSDGVSNWIGV